jgi:GNAT superfamily N-acetyltransferase
VGGHFNILLDFDEQFIGYVGVMRREVLFGDEKVLIGGIRGLVVEKAFRSKGFGKLLMTEAQKVVFRTLKADFGCLLCLDSMKSFFAALGWRPLGCPVFIENCGQSQRWSEIAMALDPEEKTDFSRLAKIDLKGKAF